MRDCKNSKNCSCSLFVSLVDRNRSALCLSSSSSTSLCEEYLENHVFFKHYLLAFISLLELRNGMPGAGKSTCIHLCRRFFQECLHWQHGVEFQFVASMNTMAALIGGSTLHSWGQIPINASNAEDKMTNKGDDHDIDQLFLNALNLRWLFIDEFPTNAPGVLGTLDAFLRRAYCRHLYAKSKQGVRNIRFVKK